MNNDLNALLKWRCIGPFRGGRVVAVAGDVSKLGTFYFGACAGGIWKTEDAGQYWECISDGFLNTASVGALAVSEVDPNVIYAGMGESTIRIDVSHGDGIYKSTDAGRTWQHMGLEDTRHIGKVRIHPQNPDIVYVAALGHAFGPNQQRGVFKSVDGGKNWQHVLFKSENAGAVDLSIDIQNPRIIYTSIWQARRSFYDITSGGPDSGIWMSRDGGDTWHDITQNKGLPKGVLGKIGIAASPAKSGRVWALIEAGDNQGGMYRSDDYGETWQFVAQNDQLISRAWYYMHLTADPQDADTIYVNNLSLWKSTDGGATYTEIGTPHGDNHDLWIDPNNPQRMVQGNDGGACVSFNGGDSWSTIYNQPTAQFYHLATDNRNPYHVYGTQQDNSSIAVPSRSHNSAIMWRDCYPAGSGESGYIVTHPENPNIVYVGAIGSSPGGGNALQRYDHETKQIRLISSWPEAERGKGAESLKYRFAWTYPIALSPHDPNIMYVGGNMVLKSTDEGQSWEEISPDLTRANPDMLKPSGGPINRDAVGAETYATVFAFTESPHIAGVLWAGSDDGLVHVSKDSGEEWVDVTPPDLPEYTMISCIETSPHQAGTVYVAATGYKNDDYQPYLYKTDNYGESWQKITAGIPDNDFTRVIRSDPAREGLLYAGTETGLYISFNDGESWERFQLNLPVTPIHDLEIKGTDLIAATHGRSFWILDDLTALHQLNDDIVNQSAYLLKPPTSERIVPKVFEGLFDSAPGKGYMGTMGLGAAHVKELDENNAMTVRHLDAGENPPKGVVVSYFLKDDPEGKIKLSFMDNDGNVLREFTSMDDADRQAQKDNPDAPKKLFAPKKAGWNRFIWNMRVEDGVQLETNDPQADVPFGPMVVPGDYQAQLTVDDTQLSESFSIVLDGLSDANQADVEAQFDLLLAIRDKFSETYTAINTMRRVRKQLNALAERFGVHDDLTPLAEKAKQLHEDVLAIEEVLLVPDLKKGWPGMLNNGIRLAQKLGGVVSVVALGDYKPTDQSHAVFEKLSAEIDEQLATFEALYTGALADFNQELKASDIDVVGV